MNEDIEAWLDWYGDNKCNLTVEGADSIVASKLASE
jgi:hypothetical protein